MKEKTSKAIKSAGSILLAPFRWIKKMKKPVKIVLCLILAAAIAAGGFTFYKNRKAKEASKENDAGTSVVRKGSVINSITGSGTVEPIEQREIVPEVNGKIVESYFAEGESVKTGDILYRFEMTSATNAIESAGNNVQKAQTNLSNRQSSLAKITENIEKLTIKATSSGKISDLSLRVGEDASGKVCTLTNFKEQTATVPFSSAHIASINIGDSANVAVDKYMINVDGKVVRKYTAPDTLASGAVVYYVEILLSSDYILEENVNVTATVGGISSASYGSVKYASPVTVNAEQKGKVQKVNFKNGDWVNEGDIIAVLKNNDLNDELRNARQSLSEAQMNLTEAMNNLEDKEENANKYIVTSPIDGVILTKEYNVGDTINGQNAPAMMVVADMSKMKFTISADELDIAKIQLGQSVQVTADALENQRLVGTITNVSKLGTASNGVTNYPIEVTIDEPGDLMPGMNVSAEIIVEQAYNALYLPVEAVEYFGGKYYVTIVGEMENMPEVPDFTGGGFGNRMKKKNAKEENSDNKSEEKTAEKGGNTGSTPQYSGGYKGGKGFGGQRPQGGQMPQRMQGETSENAERPVRQLGDKPENTSAEKEEKKSEEAPVKAEEKAAKSETAEKSEEKAYAKGENAKSVKREEPKVKLYGKEERVEVEVGIVTDTYYEIKSGVEYGQVVKNSSQVSSSGNSFGMPGGMMGGMPGGMMGGGNRNFGGANRSFGGNRMGGR